MKHFPDLHQTAARPPLPFSRAAPHAAPQVEALIALFDAASPLTLTLADIAGQSWTSWALAVRDDGSRDGGPALVDDFAGAIPDRPVRSFGGPRLGRARAAMTLCAEADPLTDIAVLLEPGARLAPDLFRRAVRIMAADCGGRPALHLVRPGVWLGRERSVGFDRALAGRLPRVACLVANRAALDLLRLGAAYRGPIACPVAWAAQLVAGAGGTVRMQRMPGCRAARIVEARTPGPTFRRTSAVAALRAMGPLMTPAARLAVEHLDGQGTRLAMARVPAVPARWSRTAGTAPVRAADRPVPASGHPGGPPVPTIADLRAPV